MVLSASSDAVVTRSPAAAAYLPISSSFAAWINCLTCETKRKIVDKLSQTQLLNDNSRQVHSNTLQNERRDGI